MTVRLPLLVAILGLTAAACDGSDGVRIPPDPTPGCETQEECGDGYVCDATQCEIGECVAATYVVCGMPILDENNEPMVDEDGNPLTVTTNCCREWEFCNFDRTCQPDPNSPIGIDCEVNEDCTGIGEFCSGGTCYDSNEQTPCTATYQCPTGERCDQTASLCVPDVGGCSFCGSAFPELCCEEDFYCDEEVDRCIEIDAELECTPATVQEDCLPLELCNEAGQCVQCITTADCGPGLTCREDDGVCISEANQCQSDADCTGDKRCAPVSGECVIPLCETDSDCAVDFDPRWQCNLGSFACFLPPPNCGALDMPEPNNSLNEAIDLGGLTGDGVLCRQDSDYLKFPILADKRYAVQIMFADYNVKDNKVSLLRQDGMLIDEITLPNTANSATLVGITAEDEADTEWYVRITGSGVDADIWPYTVLIEEDDAPDITTCEDEMAMGIEPNNTIATATETMPGTHVFARCDSSDVDYYRVEVPVQHGIDVTLTHFVADGDLTLSLYDSNGDLIDDNDTLNSTKSVDAPEGETVFYVGVELYSQNVPNIDGQQYTLDIDATPRPAVCDDDPGEPANDLFATAMVFPVNTPTDALRCVNEDVDYNQFTVPADEGAKLDVTFTHSQGNIRVDLYDDNETLVGSSDSSTGANGVESIEIPFSGQDETYVAKVSLSTTSGQVGQAYSMVVNTYDASTCVASEPVPNNTFVTGRCIGTPITDLTCEGAPLPNPVIAPALATCSTTPDTVGCGSTCGALDEDWYRVGKLNDGQLLAATLTYDHAAMNGRLGLALVRASGDYETINFINYDPNTEGNNTITLALNASTVNPAFAREYGVVVMPEGSEGFAALPYTLDVEVGPPCQPDAWEPNSNPSQSHLIRTTGMPGVAYNQTFDQTLCGFDTDVYELILFVGETLTVRYAGPETTTVNIGERPDDIEDEAVTLLPSGEGMDLSPCTITPPGASPNEVCVQATWTTAEIKQTYLTIKRESGTSGATIGPYRLVVDVTP